jgi:hypothetical protein
MPITTARSRSSRPSTTTRRRPWPPRSRVKG